MLVLISTSEPAQLVVGHTVRRTEPMKFALAPFASGVPIVTFEVVCAGGAHDPLGASGPPCAVFGVVHSWKAGTSEANTGLAPFGRGYARSSFLIVPAPAASAIVAPAALLSWTVKPSSGS